MPAEILCVEDYRRQKFQLIVVGSLVTKKET
jgi:hypothetical protein